MEDELSGVRGVTSTEVGYIGGRTNHPTYEQVCSGTTGHTEAVKISFDRDKTSYKSLVKHFLEVHGPYADISGVHGGQYKTAIFYLSKAQETEANEVLGDIQKEKKRRIFAYIQPAGTFWRAEEYHQQYFKKNGLGSCRR